MTNQEKDPSSHGQENQAPTQKEDHPFKVAIRTLAGHTYEETVRPSELIRSVTDKAVNFFVSRSELAPDQYSLALPRINTSSELDPTASLKDLGIVADDVLVLISRTPQLDG